MQNIIHPNLEKDINNWFETKFNGFTLPFYSSIDLRNSGCKIAPVDANLFPAGFNNLSEVSRVTAAKLIKSYFETKQYKKALIIPENYTRNKMYIENVFAIEKILQLAGFETKTGLFHSEAYNLIELYETIVSAPRKAFRKQLVKIQPRQSLANSLEQTIMLRKVTSVVKLME
ncbi:MAG: glutamate--cysteine ligase, partial [Wolbachia sp.]